MFKSLIDNEHDKLDRWFEKNEPEYLNRTNDLELTTADSVFHHALHVYYWSNFLYRMSVTGFLHSFFHHFEEDETIHKITTGHRRNDPSYKYCGMDARQIKLQWKDMRDDACTKGTRMHAYCEYYQNRLIYSECDPLILGLEYEYANTYFDIIKKKWRPFLTEKNVCSLKYELIGQIDGLYQKLEYPIGDKRILLLDYKRSKEIKESGFQGQKGCGPCNDQDDCNKQIYFLQLNTYAVLVEESSDFIVEEMYIVVFSDTNEDYVEIPVPNLRHKVRKMFQYRRFNLLMQDMRNIDFFIREICEKARQFFLEQEKRVSKYKIKKLDGDVEEILENIDSVDEETLYTFIDEVQEYDYYYKIKRRVSLTDYLNQHRRIMSIKFYHDMIVYKEGNDKNYREIAADLSESVGKTLIQKQPEKDKKRKLKDSCEKDNSTKETVKKVLFKTSSTSKTAPSLISTTTKEENPEKKPKTFASFFKKPLVSSSVTTSQKNSDPSNVNIQMNVQIINQNIQFPPVYSSTTTQKEIQKEKQDDTEFDTKQLPQIIPTEPDTITKTEKKDIYQLFDRLKTNFSGVRNREDTMIFLKSLRKSIQDWKIVKEELYDFLILKSDVDVMMFCGNGSPNYLGKQRRAAAPRTIYNAFYNIFFMNCDATA